MWSKRKLIDFQQTSSSGHEATVVTGTFVAQQSSQDAQASLQVPQDAFHCIASLSYTLIPHLCRDDAVALSGWCLQRWVQAETAGSAVEAIFAANEAISCAFTQVEYFFAGTDNGQLFVVALMPPHLAHRVAETQDAVFAPLRARLNPTASASSARDMVPLTCSPRRLLHQHAREEPVTALDHIGTLVASGSDDRSIALSFFHPVPSPVLTLTQPSPIRCLKLWEGGSFLRSSDDTPSANTAQGTQRQATCLATWRAAMEHAERAAVYLFAGDEAALVRLWRVDVQARTFVLLHVLVCATRTRPVHSSLDMLAREDVTSAVVSRETTQSVQCIAIDADARLIAGSEEGLYVWDLSRLSWKTTDETLEGHPLCWCESERCPLSVLSDAPCSTQQTTVAVRAARLVNLHVFVRCTAFVEAQLRQHAAQTSTQAKAATSKWKPKYARAMTNGAAVGTVTNTVYIPPNASDAASVLENAVVSVTFEGGELSNDVKLPLSCVEPVVYPLCFLPTFQSSCFAVEVLQANGRLISSGSNGKIIVWSWSPTEARYLPTVVAGAGTSLFRGLGRRLCVLRSPDVFISCGYDDGLVKEWHVYDSPELMVRCERRFTMMPSNAYARAGTAIGVGKTGTENDVARQAADAMKALVSGATTGTAHPSSGSPKDEKDENDSTDEDAWKEGGEVVSGISCAVAFSPFAALFLVGAFEHTVQTFSLCEVQGCEAPRNFIYNGFKTVKLPAALVEDAYRRLEEEEAPTSSSS